MSEPGSGAETTVEVCMSVISGAVGRELIVVPQFTEGTATGRGGVLAWQQVGVGVLAWQHVGVECI